MKKSFFDPVTRTRRAPAFKLLADMTVSRHDGLPCLGAKTDSAQRLHSFCPETSPLFDIPIMGSVEKESDGARKKFCLGG